MQQSFCASCFSKVSQSLCRGATYSVREASHTISPIRNVNLTFLSIPTLGNVKNIFDIFAKDTAFSAIPLPLASIKKVVCAQNLIPDAGLTKTEGIELTDELKAKVILYPFQDVSKKSKLF